MTPGRKGGGCCKAVPPVRQQPAVADPEDSRPAPAGIAEVWPHLVGTTESVKKTFTGDDLCDVEIADFRFVRCVFRNVRFNCAVLTRITFDACEFHGCNFFDATLEDCAVTDSRFDRCQYTGTQVMGGDWSGSLLPGADLSTADFAGTVMRQVGLSGAHCAHATFRHVDLAGANLNGADFTGADLRGSVLTAFDPRVVELRDAIITVDQAADLAEALRMTVRDT
jgi:uncharacterized protein YjbI with pentapeptide repeats